MKVSNYKRTIVNPSLTGRLTPEQRASIKEQQDEQRKLTEPTAAEMAENFAGAMVRWTAAGFTTLSKGAYDERSAICEGCDRWDGSARFGLGKCTAKGCGCTKLKRWLATEKCPLKKWPVQPAGTAVATPQNPA